MKKNIFLLLFCCNLINAQEKRQAIDDFLQSIVPDYNQEIFITKEKISINHVIEVFKGKTNKDSITKFYKRDEREEIKEPLYNENDWIQMEKKYYDESKKENPSKDFAWCSKDFNYVNIVFFSIHHYIEFIVNYSEQKGPTTKIFSFSEPIYYSSKRYLTFKVAEGTTQSINGLTNNYLIIMEKRGGKWIVKNKSYQLDVFY